MFFNPNGAGRQPEFLYEAESSYTLSPRYANNEMIPEAKENWINALREPDRKQLKNRLEKRNTVTGEKFQCCLGVLCDVQGLPSVVKNHYQNVQDIYYKFNNIDRGRDALPNLLWMQGLGIQSSDASFNIKFTLFGERFYQNESLLELNDAGWTFNQIADIVEYFF